MPLPEIPLPRGQAKREIGKTKLTKTLLGHGNWSAEWNADRRAALVSQNQMVKPAR
jgi:hypothetical protein